MKRDDLPVRSYVLTCTSGDTSGLIVPKNVIAHLESIEIDTSEISGNIGMVKVTVRDTYTPTGGSETTKTRKQVSVKCGDVVHIDVDGDVALFDEVELRTNVSGPVVTLGVALEM